MNDVAGDSLTGTRKRKRGSGKRGIFDAVLPPDSEIAIAHEFVREYGGIVRYVAEWGRWMVWDDVSWYHERTLWTYDRCIKLAAEHAAHPSLTTSEAMRVATRKVASNVYDLIRADRTIAADADQWDSDIYFLNTPGGVVHLDGSGIIEPCRTDYYMTKEAAVAPDPDMPIELWQSFLNRITDNNEELQKYLQRVCGYCLTGDTREHALFFLWGTGGNGKTVFIETIAGILADYHRTAAIDTFSASNGDRHPTELANLRGARLVTAVETEEGRRWDETRIKTLTGGDLVSARFMRQDFFTYRPTCKVMVAGNHKPQLRTVDEAIKRRMHLIPFTQKIQKEERDLELALKLRDERPGILMWMIEGCVEWQANGLQPPAAVIDATNSYLDAEDVLGAWVEEKCDTGDPNHFRTTAATLYASWRGWAEAAGEFVGSQKRFSQSLEDRGFRRERTREGTVFHGLSIKPEPQSERDRGRYGDDE